MNMIHNPYIGKFLYRESVIITRNISLHLLMFPLFLVMYFPVSTRSATGEDWHKIMLACYDVAKCDKSVDIKKYGEHCGTTAGAIIFFCTFIFLCMFLVSDEIHEYKNTSKEILSFLFLFFYPSELQANLRPLLKA